MKNKKDINLIIDIDGVVVDSHRMLKYVPEDKYDRKGWDEFAKHYDLCTYPPQRYIMFLLFDLQCKYNIKTIFFVTAREDMGNMREVAWKHINDVLGDFIRKFNIETHLYLRNYADYRASYEVKQDILNQKIKPYKYIDLAIDDDIDIINMFKANNINTFNFTYLRFDKYKNVCYN